jgi:hypothetical protein
MTSRMIADIVKNRLRNNLEMTVTKTRGLVKQKFPTIQPSYNKLWRERELTIAGEESMANWGWFMQWLRKEVVGHGKIIMISDQHLSIRRVFERQDFG